MSRSPIEFGFYSSRILRPSRGLLSLPVFRHASRSRALVRQIFEIAANLIPDYTANTLTVRLHRFTQAAQDQAIEKLLAELNATQRVFPGTRLRLIFKIGSS